MPTRIDPALLDERAAHLRAEGLTDPQLRSELKDEGFSQAAISKWIHDHPRGEEQASKPSPSPDEDKPAPSSSGPLFTLNKGGTGRGVFLAIVLYAPAMAYLQGGGDGLKSWFMAKLFNKTASDPGETTEAFINPAGVGSGGSTTATAASFTIAKTKAKRKPPKSGSSAAGSAPASGAAQEALKVAEAQIGKPYVWGAKGPNAFDCSGLTHYAYAQVGIKIALSTTGQWFNGRRVKRGDLRPGDLVFPIRHHVQMFVDGNTIVEAPRPGLKVRHSTMGRFNLMYRRIA